MLRYRKIHSKIIASTTPLSRISISSFVSTTHQSSHPQSNTNPHLPLFHDHPDFYARLLLSCCKRLNTSDAHHLFDERPQTSSYCRTIHARIFRLGFSPLANIQNGLVDLYSKFGDLHYAHKVLDEMGCCDSTAWNSIMSARSRMGSPDGVLEMFSSLRGGGVSPNMFTFAIVLSACARLALVGCGKQVHCDVLKMGFACASFCVGSLIDMYAKFHLVDDARKVFDETRCMDTVSWTAMISGYAQIGKEEEALNLFERMLTMGCTPDRITIVTVITACLTLGRLDYAQELFLRMPFPNDVTWNAMISGFTRNGHELKALEFFKGMLRAGLHPTRSTLGSVLGVSTDLLACYLGRQVQSLAIKLGLYENVFVGSSLINMYAKSGAIDEAREVFNALSERNLVTWNAMLCGYTRNEKFQEALDLFLEMKELCIHPDEFTYVSMFCGCACLENLKLGQQLHSTVVKCNLAGSLFVGNSIIDMYAKFRDMDSAERQFMSMHIRDMVTWNTYIVGLVFNEYYTDAFAYTSYMLSSSVSPDVVSIASVLSACADSKAYLVGKQIHCLSIKLGSEQNLYVGSSIVNFYAKFEEMEAARRVFLLMPDKNVATRNALMEGYVLNGNPDEALSLFQQMLNEGLDPSEFTFVNVLSVCRGLAGLYLGLQLHSHMLKSGLLCSDVFLGVALISMYLRYGNHQSIDRLLSEMPYNRNVVLWTVIISEFNQNNAGWDALSFFRKMRHCDVLPDQATFVSVLRACSDLATLKNGKQLHCLVMHMGYYSDVSVCSSLVDFYSKCGDINSSHQVFNETGNTTSIILWNSMIVGLAKNGLAENALVLFKQMEQLNIPSDDVTILGALTACSHAGYVSKGHDIFNAMEKKYGIRPRYDHYACMVDLLGRAGYLKEAEELIYHMPIEADSVIWSTLVSSCRTHEDCTRGARAVEKLIKLDPQNSSSYVLLSNMCAMYENWDGVKMVRRKMNDKVIRKSPGCSWIIVGNDTDHFVSADISHPDTIKIYEGLKYLTNCMRNDDDNDDYRIFAQYAC